MRTAVIDERWTPPARALTIEDVTEAIRASWTADTAAVSDWSSEHSAVGQCAVSALIIQDYFNGALLRSVVAGASHYWNQLPDGAEVDVSRDQFESFVPEIEPEERERRYVLSFPDTVQRYDILRAAVTKRLGIPAAAPR